MSIEFILTCGFLSLGGLLLTVFTLLFARIELLFLIGLVLALMGAVPLVIFWYNCVCALSNRYFSNHDTNSTNEEDPHEDCESH